MTLPLSIIISTYDINRYYDIVDVLTSLSKQDFNKFETIIIVDEDQKYYKKLREVAMNNNPQYTKVIFNPINRGLSYSRNLGIKYVNGDIVAYLDDDVIVSPHWAKEIIGTFKRYKNVGAVAGHILPLWMDETMEWFPEELYWIISCSYTLTPKRELEVDRGFGANMAFRKSVLTKLGGFREDLGLNGREKWLGGEDTDIFLRVKEMGYKVIFNPRALVYHKIHPQRIKLKSLMKRAFGGGKSVAIMKKQYKYIPQKEHTYLKIILRTFYVPKILDLVRSPSIKYVKQLEAVTVVVLFEGLGYLFGTIKNQI